MNNTNINSILNNYNSNKEINRDQRETNSGIISIRYELFDHLIYPLSVKFDDNLIIQLFRKLHIMSSIDYKISLKEWIDESTKTLQGFTGNLKNINKITKKTRQRFYSIHIRFFHQI